MEMLWGQLSWLALHMCSAGVDVLQVLQGRHRPWQLSAVCACVWCHYVVPWHTTVPCTMHDGQVWTEGCGLSLSRVASVFPTSWSVTNRSS